MCMLLLCVTSFHDWLTSYLGVCVLGIFMKYAKTTAPCLHRCVNYNKVMRDTEGVLVRRAIFDSYPCFWHGFYPSDG